jgi:hypothetical protein
MLEAAICRYWYQVPVLSKYQCSSVLTNLPVRYIEGAVWVFDKIRSRIKKEKNLQCPEKSFIFKILLKLREFLFTF